MKAMGSVDTQTRFRHGSIEKFIDCSLAKEHRMDSSEIDKFLLNMKDFMMVLRVTETNIFPHKRQQVQLLVAELNVSRPGALLGITYVL